MPDISTKSAAGTLTGTEAIYVLVDPTGTKLDRITTPAAIVTYTVGASAFTEAVQDLVGGMIAAAGGSYNDAGGSITLPGGGGGLTAEDVRDTIATALVAGSNVTITVNDAGDTITIAAAGGGATTWALPAAAANPASPYTAAGLTGSTVVRITGITGAKTLNAPTGTFPAGRNWVLYQVAATGGPWTLTMGAGVTHDGIGAAPTFSVPSGGVANVLIYTDDQGSTWKYAGDFDFAANKAAVLSALGLGTLKVRFDIFAPANGTEILLLENVHIGTILSALCWTDTGSASVNLQLADKTGASDYTVTGATSITGLGAVAVTTTPARTAATAANVMAKTGLTDRVLQAVLTGVTGTPNKLTIEVEFAL